MKAIIIGIGNIGRWHFHSLAGSYKMVVFDKYPDVYTSLYKHIIEHKLMPEFEVVLRYMDLSPKIAEEDIVIISTTVDDRLSIFKNVIRKKPKAIILEKPAFKTLEEYEEANNLTKNSNTQVFVNLPRVYDPNYQKIRLLKGKISINSYYTTKTGLLCNLVHYVHLLDYLTGQPALLSTWEHIEVINSKREGYKEVVGSLICKTPNGGKLCVLRGGINEVNTTVHNKEQNELFKYKETPCLVSNTTFQAVKEIVCGGQCSLPTLDDCYNAHKVLYEYMKNNSLNELRYT